MEALVASMRPPQKAGGNRDGHQVVAGLLAASMRPPQKAGGGNMTGIFDPASEDPLQ